MVLCPKKRCIVRISCLQNRHAEQTTLRDERPREGVPRHKERPSGSDNGHYVTHGRRCREEGGIDRWAWPRGRSGEGDTGKSYWTKSLRDSLELTELVMLRGMR
jgi:hypothetical protein